MKKYHYLVEDVMDESDLQELLNRRGAGGWKLVEVKFIRRDQNNYYKLFLMREA